MSSEPRLLRGGEDYLERSSILRDPRQRRVLSILIDRSSPLTERDLSVQVAARETERAPPDVPEDDRQSIHVDLHHRCLPMLEENGWIQRYPEGVVAAEPPSVAVDDSSLPDLRDSDQPFWEAIGALLARPRRQDLVSILGDGLDRLTLEELATEVRERGRCAWAAERRDGEPTIRSTLHHVDLPKLADVGLIEYDPEDKTITSRRPLTSLVDRTDLDARVPDGPDSDRPSGEHDSD